MGESKIATLRWTRRLCEGVETKQQVEFLRQVDCDLVQGYYYSRPVPQNVFSRMLADDDFVLHHEQAQQ